MIQVTAPAFVMGKQNIHSSKTNKDYTKISLVIDGNYTSFIVPAQKGEQIAKAKQFAELMKTHTPQPCEVALNVEVSERGQFVTLDWVR